MSPQDSSKQPIGPHCAPRPDIYTVLLVIALIALLLGLLSLYLEMNMYEWEIKGGPTASADHHHAAAVALATDPWLPNPTSSTDAPTTLQLFQFRPGG